MGAVSDVSEQNRLEINWVRSAGSALGAVSAAVVLSTLGAAGTLIGAALGSLVITVGGAIYAHSLELTRQRVAAARASGARREAVSVSGAPVAAAGSNAGLRHAAVRDEPPPGGSRGQMLRGLPWTRIIVMAGALFAVAMAVILAFELSTGRAVSSFTGGTSGTGPGTSIPGIDGPVSDPKPTGTEGVPQPDQTPAQEQPGQHQAPTQDPAPQEGQTPAPTPEAPTPSQEAPAPSQEAPSDPVPSAAPEQPAQGEAP